MTEEEYYKANRFKINESDISTWGYFPLGEPKRMIYDYHYQSLKQFLIRYYQVFHNREQWTEQWMNAIVIPAFENDLERLSKRLGIGVSNVFSHKRMIEFYHKIEDIDFFEDDVKLFFSWMNGMNFFESQETVFQDWINSRDYNIGGRHRMKEDLYSLQDIAKEEFGNNLVRDKLMSLEWHKR